MLVVSLDPEIYLKSNRTQARLVEALARAIDAAFTDEITLTRITGHRLAVTTSAPDAIDRLARIFGVRSVETVEPIEVIDLAQLAGAVTERFAPIVAGHTFAVRPRRLGTHSWKSTDLAVEAGRLLVAAGGTVDLSNPEVTVAIRIVDTTAYLTMSTTTGVGGLPVGTQGKALMMFSGGIDSPVAAYLIAHRGVELDYLHFSLGCGAADHAAGIAHLLTERYGAGTDPVLHVADLEPAVSEIQRRVPGRQRQMALKAVMYRVADITAGADRATSALVTGESLGQVSTQTLENVAALDRLIDVPVLRPLIGLGKAEIIEKARAIGTLEVSARTTELCDIAGGARVSVGTAPHKLAAIAADLSDVVEHAVMTLKSTRLADWLPGS